MTPNPIRILIVDDHVMVRMGLASLVSDSAGMELVGEARTAREGIDLYLSELPDIVLMDGILPDMHGTEATRILLASHPQARIIHVSINEGPEDIRRALAAGALGYVPKSSSRATILEAIRSVAAGHPFLPVELAAKVAQLDNSVRLSEREIEVLALVAKGRANKEIAATLGLTENTIKTHLSHILSKLGAPDRTRAVTIAIERGIIRL